MGEEQVGTLPSHVVGAVTRGCCPSTRMVRKYWDEGNKVKTPWGRLFFGRVFALKEKEKRGRTGGGQSGNSLCKQGEHAVC